MSNTFSVMKKDHGRRAIENWEVAEVVGKGGMPVGRSTRSAAEVSMRLDGLDGERDGSNHDQNAFVEIPWTLNQFEQTLLTRISIANHKVEWNR